MALTLTQAELSAAIRLGDSTEETAEATRLLAYVTAAISTHLADAYEDAPEAIVNEAAIRLAGYLFDMPNAGRGLSYANAGRNSGAWTILLPYRIHRAGSTDDAVAAAQEAVGSTSNPVTDVAISGGNLVVTFNDGTTRDEPLPAGMAGDGTDQAARRRPRRKGRRTVRRQRRAAITRMRLTIQAAALVLTRRRGMRRRRTANNATTQPTHWTA